VLELLVEPVEPVVPVLPVSPEPGVVDGAVDEVDEPLGDVLELELVLPVPVAPIEDVVLGDVVLRLAVVSVLVPVLPVVVLLPLRLPEPVAEPVVVDGVVLLLPVVVLVELVPLEPVVLVSEFLWQALSVRAAANATATAVSLVFIRTP
jgi:hypothetical protein